MDYFLIQINNIVITLNLKKYFTDLHAIDTSKPYKGTFAQSNLGTVHRKNLEKKIAELVLHNRKERLHYF